MKSILTFSLLIGLLASCGKKEEYIFEGKAVRTQTAMKKDSDLNLDTFIKAVDDGTLDKFEIPNIPLATYELSANYTLKFYPVENTDMCFFQCDFYYEQPKITGDYQIEITSQHWESITFEDKFGNELFSMPPKNKDDWERQRGGKGKLSNVSYSLLDRVESVKVTIDCKVFPI